MVTGDPIFRQLPAVKATAWFAAGIICGELCRIPAAFYLWMTLFILCIIGIITHRRSGSDAVWISALLIMGALRIASIRADLAAWDIYDEKPILLTGEVVAVYPQPGESRVIVLRPDWVSTYDATKRFPQGDLRMRLGPGTDLDPGARIALSGEKRPYTARRNPGGRDLRAEFAKRQIVGWVDLHECAVLSHGNSSVFTRVRKAIGGALRSILPDREAGLLTGMLLGDKSTVPEAVKNDFRSSGLYHLLVVSGAHIGFFLTFLTLLLSPFSLPLRLRRRIMLFGVWGYALPAGGSPATIRAALMISLFLLSFELKRVVSPWNLWGSAALLILLLDPQQLFLPGFQLSFAAAAGVLFALDRYDQRGIDHHLAQTYPRKIIASARRNLALPFLVSLSVVIFTAPILAYHFGRFAPLAVLLNLVALPLSALIFGLAWLAVLLEFIVGPAVEPLNAALELGIKVLELLADLGARSPGAASSVPFGVLGAFGLVLLFLLIVLSRRWNRRLLWAGVGLACFWLLPIAGQTHALQVEFLDVGQGDATLLQFPDGSRLMIDCGNENAARYELLPSFRRRGVDRIHALLLTHFDADHAGGAVALMENLRVDRIIVNTVRTEESLGRRILQTARALQIPVKAMACGDTLTGFRGARCLALWPPKSYHASDNSSSIVLRVSFEDCDLLFTGDISRKEEEVLLRAGSYLQSEVLKVSHHGGSTSSGRPFLDCVQPRLALIGCGRDNPYGHPDPQTLRDLEEIGCRVHRTDLDQAGVWRVSGDSVQPLLWR